MTVEKRNQLVFLVLVTGLVMAILYLAAVSGMRNAVVNARGALQAAKTQLESRQRESRVGVDIERSLAECSVRLGELEKTMPGEDALDWARQTILLLATKKCSLHMEPLSMPQVVTEVMPEPPPGYIYMRCALKGAGSFAQVGTFLATLENELPTIQVEEFDIGVFSARQGADSAQLEFTAQISFLAPLGAKVSR